VTRWSKGEEIFRFVARLELAEEDYVGYTSTPCSLRNTASRLTGSAVIKLYLPDTNSAKNSRGMTADITRPTHYQNFQVASGSRGSGFDVTSIRAARHAKRFGCL
jgi:hypothetical protein